MWGYGLIFFIYLLALLIIDARRGFFEFLSTAFMHLPVLISLALISYGIRYFRWFLLLRWAGIITPAWSGWLAYLSGFALTATPGKVGELLRIRYFGFLGVSPSRVMSAFVLERSLDLIVVFFLASLFVANQRMLGLAVIFVVMLLFIVGLVIFQPACLRSLGLTLDAKGWSVLSRLVFFVAQALSGCRIWLKPWPILISFSLGLCAWLVTAYTFVYLIEVMNIEIPGLTSFSIYPLAMLAGAASMIPGGVGSTEAAIVFQLNLYDVPISIAILIAVVVRLGTMWFSILSGLLAVLIQEYQICKNLKKV